MGAGKRVLTAAALVLVLSSQAPADTRKENIDIIVALDKSLSMENKIGAVETWVNSFILDQLVVPGDFLTVIPFYGKTDALISTEIKGDADRSAAKSLISGIRGDGRYTDIGNALDALKAQLAAKEKDGRQKYVLLLTDGIQEAPPSSKYWSKNGAFNHEFLANTKTIQQKGWKVMILGIGTDTAARQLATELQGSYSELTGKVTPESLAATTGALFQMPSVEGTVSLGPVNSGGSARVQFKLKSSGLAGDATITVGDVSVEAGGRSYSSLLGAPRTLTVKKGATEAVDLPLKFPAGLPAGASSGTLTFSFGSTDRFAPAQVPVTLTVQGWVQSNLAIAIPGLVVALAILAGILFLVLRLTRGKPLQFSVLVEDAPAGPSVSLGSGGELFLNDNGSDFALVAHRNARSVARLSVAGGTLALSAVKADRFPKVAQFPPNAMGKAFPMRTESGRSVTLKIQPADGAAAKNQTAPVNSPSAQTYSKEKTAAPAKAPARKAPTAKARPKAPPANTRNKAPARGRKK